jgi:monooxygenase
MLPARQAGTAMRWFKALSTQAFFELSRHRPELVKRMVRRQLERQLPASFDIDTHFTPRYNPWDQRFCIAPDGDLFRAIRNGSVSVVTDHVESFTERGLLLRSGTELEGDIIITATGLELLFIGGIQLQVDGEPVDVASKLVYKGMMLEGVPNLAIAVGYTNASWTLKCDLTCNYVCRLINRMHARGVRVCTPVAAGPAVSTRPLLDLTSGYIQRSAHRFPRQGTRFPWQVHQSYLRDYRALRLRGVEDQAMVFSSPAREMSARHT